MGGRESKGREGGWVGVAFVPSAYFFLVPIFFFIQPCAFTDFFHEDGHWKVERRKNNSYKKTNRKCSQNTNFILIDDKRFNGLSF